MFSSEFYEILHDGSKDIVRTHDKGYFAFWGQNHGF